MERLVKKSCTHDTTFTKWLARFVLALPSPPSGVQRASVDREPGVPLVSTCGGDTSYTPGFTLSPLRGCEGKCQVLCRPMALTGSHRTCRAIPNGRVSTRPGGFVRRFAQSTLSTLSLLRGCKGGRHVLRKPVALTRSHRTYRAIPNGRVLTRPGGFVRSFAQRAPSRLHPSNFTLRAA